MTYPPTPPPPGSYPPPGDAAQGYPVQGYPPPSGYYPPPGYGQPSGGFYPAGPAAGLPQSAYTPWITRVGATLIDSAIYGVIVALGAFPYVFTGTRTCVQDSSDSGFSANCEVTPSTLGSVLYGLAMLAAFAFLLWNYGYRQGTTGSSIGKSVMKFKVVGEATGQPIGFGRSVLRQLAHLLDGIACYVGYLFPLWDAKRQTFADKIMSTVCLPR